MPPMLSFRAIGHSPNSLEDIDRNAIPPIQRRVERWTAICWIRFNRVVNRWASPDQRIYPLDSLASIPD